VDVSDSVVLAVGAATVIAMAVQAYLQTRSADRIADLAARQTRAAELQVEAAHEQVRVAQAQAEVLKTQAELELAARIVGAFGGGGAEQHEVRIFNGGRHPASQIEAWYADEGGEPVTPRVPHPVLMPGDDASLQMNLPAGRARPGEPPLYLRVAYTDGRGRHDEVDAGFQALQF
jgi:hypothetical protein